MKTAEKKSYHHGNLEEALVKAGMKEARVTGSRNLGVTHLAKLVNVSPMAIYRHFSSGESLKAAISQRAREELANRMLAALAKETDVKLRFQVIGRAYIQFGLDEPGLFSVAFVESEEPPKRLDDPSAWMVLQDVILDLCHAGLIESTEVESVAVFAWSTVHGYTTIALGPSLYKPDTKKKDIDEFLERTLAGIVKTNKR
jgi:AcrR family transcriptional regulator